MEHSKSLWRWWWPTYLATGAWVSLYFIVNFGIYPASKFEFLINFSTKSVESMAKCSANGYQDALILLSGACAFSLLGFVLEMIWLIPYSGFYKYLYDSNESYFYKVIMPKGAVKSFKSFLVINKVFFVVGVIFLIACEFLVDDQCRVFGPRVYRNYFNILIISPILKIVFAGLIGQHFFEKRLK